MSSHQDIAAEVRALHNRICILHDSDLVRVVGFHEDAMDAYYRVRVRTRDARDGRTEWFATCVGACVSLEGVERYEQIERDFARQGCPPEPEFLQTVSTRAQDVLAYEHHMVDRQHPDCDRIVIDGRADDSPLWFVILRDDDGSVISIEEHDHETGRSIDPPSDGLWGPALAALIVGRGGSVEAVAAANARCSDDRTLAERDHP